MLYGKHFYSDAPLEASPLSMVFPPVSHWTLRSQVRGNSNFSCHYLFPQEHTLYKSLGKTFSRSQRNSRAKVLLHISKIQIIHANTSLTFKVIPEPERSRPSCRQIQPYFRVPGSALSTFLVYKAHLSCWTSALCSEIVLKKPAKYFL